MFFFFGNLPIHDLVFEATYKVEISSRVIASLFLCNYLELPAICIIKWEINEVFLILLIDFILLFPIKLCIHTCSDGIRKL